MRGGFGLGKRGWYFGRFRVGGSSISYEFGDLELRGFVVGVGRELSR